RPWADSARIGLWGWSYGGYMTLLTTLRSQGAVKAAMAVAPVTDWELYDTVYTERYMGTPRDNPEGYRESAPLNHADGLRSDLLLVYGTGDDNVHPQNSVRMVRALERAGKQFRMRIYPNKTHAIAGAVTRVNLFTLLTDYITGELGAGR
ncbi:MAG TPA: prolyl oligopeptidase family serine peptidase, partial [Gemmatimonadota bacterium]|nr:prolyl oligopeptidase family serine peptidase [Gemmatimonadota bacterium]